jgi:hypothetical protein
MRSANKFSNLSIIGVFFITLINVLISTFNGSNFSARMSPAVTTGAPSTVAILPATESDIDFVPAEVDGGGDFGSDITNIESY